MAMTARTGDDLRAENSAYSRWGANSRLRWVDHSYPAGLFGVAGVGPRPWPVRVVWHRRRLAARGKKVEMTTTRTHFTLPRDTWTPDDASIGSTSPASRTIRLRSPHSAPPANAGRGRPSPCGRVRE